MKHMQRTLILAAALALGMTTVANAHDERRRGDRDGPRHSHYQDQKHYRQDHGHSHWRADKRARKHWRAHKRAQKQARRHWRAHKQARRHWQAQRRHALRHGHRHRARDHYYYDDYFGGYYPGRYQSNGFSIWFDGIGFSVADSGYDH